MKTILLFAVSALAVPLGAQVSAPSTPTAVPSTPVSVPANPVIAPTATPGIASRPGAMINPAVPTAAAPQNVGRTFQTTPVVGLPGSTGVADPNALQRPLGFPPVAAPGTAVSGVTNAGVSGTFGATTAGGPVAGTGFTPFTNAFPPIVNPALQQPVSVDFPPGTVVNPSSASATGGGVTPAPTIGGRPTAPTAVGTAPSAAQGRGASAPAPVVRPQR